MNAPIDDILALTRDLVRTPSQGGLDPVAPVLDVVADWLRRAGVEAELLRDDAGAPVAVAARIAGRQAGPLVCLDAPMDTAPVGAAEAWTVPPFAGELRAGRLYGRGAADAKAGAAIFCHVARAIAAAGGPAAGTVDLLFDGDEHTGRFGGIRAYIEGAGRRPDIVAIGYPGNEAVNIGARGFYRAVVTTHGVERHSGSRHQRPADNAILKMTELVRRLMAAPLPPEPDAAFGFGPSLTITGIAAGDGFTQVPGRCDAHVDMRLTPHFGAEEAERLLDGILEALDASWPGPRPTGRSAATTWPPYRLAEDHWAVQALRAAGGRAFGRPVRLEVTGPSNIGNYLASHGVPAMCGFGVSCGGIHGADEWIDVDTIGPVFEAYLQAVRAWCG